jgi:glycosyltransferase involved in cell wall biosynthesis
MKLLIYSHFFAPSIGGVETLVLSLSRGLAALRDGSGIPEDEPRFEITLVTQTLAENFDDRVLPFRVIRRPSNLQLWRLIRVTDVLHVAGPALTPLIFGLLARKPVVVEHHGFQTICPNGQLLLEPAGTPCPGHFMAGHHSVCLRCNSSQGWLASAKLWLLTFARRFLCARVAANITPTQWLGQLIQIPRAIAVPHGVVGLPDAGVPRGTDTLPRRTASVPQESAASVTSSVASPSGNPPVIAFLGRLVTTKGVATLLEAVQIVRRANKVFAVLVVGDGPERRALEESTNASQLAGIVRFTGRLSASELDAALGSISVVVVPSLGGEVFGLVVAENMLRGVPVVASDLGAFVEVLGDAGLTFETGNAAALAEQLARLLDDPDLRATLGKRARERAAQFCDFQRMLAAHERVYRDALIR